jgi:AcrR family transcriptional regulator
MTEANQDRKIRYTRMVLRESLIELMKAKPVTKITVTELCGAADINRTTFYAHYKDQYELLRQIEEETIAYFEDLLNKYNDKRSKREILQMLEEILQYIANNSNSIQVLLSENGDIDFQKKFFRRFTYQEQILRYFTDRTSDEAAKEYYSVFVVSGAIAFIQQWLKNNMNIPASDLAKILFRLSQQSG